MLSDSLSFHFQFLLMFLISLMYSFYYNMLVCSVRISSFPVTSTSCLLQHPLTIGTCPFINTSARVHKPIISSAVIRIFVIVTNNTQRSTNFNFNAVISSSYPYHRHDRLSVEVLSRLFET